MQTQVAFMASQIKFTACNVSGPYRDYEHSGTMSTPQKTHPGTSDSMGGRYRDHEHSGEDGPCN
jgi:hypothetical protein